MKKKLSRGFTLIELLVVITIIGILASLAIPTIGAVLQAAKKTEAKVFMGGLQTAVVNYQTEYNTYPPFMTGTNATLTDSTAWQNFYKVFSVPDKLTAAETTTLGNTRKIPFVSVQAKYLDTPDDPINATYFKDPWDKPYKMWVDTDYNNVLGDVPRLNSTNGTPISIPGNVAVYSFANDEGAHNKKSIGTWK